MANKDKQPVLIGLGVVGLIVLVYLGYTFYQNSQLEKQQQQTISIPIAEPVTPVVVEPEPEPEVEPQPIPEPEPSFVLPALDDSDQLIRDAVVTLGTNPGIESWLQADELVRKFVVLIDNTAHGSVPRKHVGFLAPEGPFLADRVNDNLYLLNEESYARYDNLAGIFGSIDAHRAVEFYVLAKPLFQQAFNELGYGDKNLDDEVFAAIGRILETPVVTQPIQLVRPVVMYKFVDPKLESLSETQKQIVRMGPENTRTIQAKLSEIALELRQVLEQ